MRIRQTLAISLAAVCVSAGVWIMIDQRAVGQDVARAARDQPEARQRDAADRDDRADREERRARRERDKKADRSEGEPGDERAEGREKDDKKNEKDSDKKSDKRGDHDPRAEIARMIFGNLELTDDQSQNVRRIMHDHREARDKWVEAHRDELHKFRDRMKQAKESGDDKKTKAIWKEFRDFMKDAPSYENAFKEVRGVLSEKQTEQFNKNLEKLRERMRDRHKKHDDKDGKDKEGKDKNTGKDKAPKKDGDKPNDHRDGEGHNPPEDDSTSHAEQGA